MRAIVLEKFGGLDNVGGSAGGQAGRGGGVAAAALLTG